MRQMRSTGIETKQQEKQEGKEKMKAKVHGKKVRKEQVGREIRETGRLREHNRELGKKLFCL